VQVFSPGEGIGLLPGDFLGFQGLDEQAQAEDDHRNPHEKGEEARAGLGGRTHGETKASDKIGSPQHKETEGKDG